MSKQYQGVITHVVDGDTLDLSIDLGFEVSITIRARVAEINAPELRDKDLEKSKLARKAKEFLEEYLFKTVTINIKGKDCYGRYICEIIEKENLGKTLVKKGLAQEVKYK